MLYAQWTNPFLSLEMEAFNEEFTARWEKKGLAKETSLSKTCMQSPPVEWTEKSDIVVLCSIALCVQGLHQVV